MMPEASLFTRTIEVGHFVLNSIRRSDECDILSTSLKVCSFVPASYDLAGSCQSLMPQKAVPRLLTNSHECHGNDH